MPESEKKTSSESRATAGADSSRPLSAGLFVAGLWGMLAPYAGKAMGLVVAVRPIVEVVDHVVPGLVVLPVALYAMFRGRAPFVGSLAAALAGFWMTATHVGLIAQGLEGILVTLPTALWHSVPGIIVLTLAAVMAVAAYKQTAEEAGP